MADWPSVLGRSRLNRLSCSFRRLPDGAPDRRYADHLGRLHGRLLHGSCRRLGHSR